jgi:hypothetical protein
VSFLVFVRIEQVCCEPSDSLVSGPCLVCASTLDLLGNPSFLVLSLETAELDLLRVSFLVGRPLVLLGASFLNSFTPLVLQLLSAQRKRVVILLSRGCDP